GDDARFVELYDDVIGSRPAGGTLGGSSGLPFAVVQPLSSLRAAIARRRGEDYRPFYARQGCVQDWVAGPVEGSRAVVELSHLEPGALTPDPAAEIVPLACVVRLWNPTPAPGARRVVTHLRAPGGPVLLDLGAGEPSRFYLDGTLVHQTDGIDRHAPERVLLRLRPEAGWHRLEVHTPIPGEHAWVMARAVGADGTPLPVATAPAGPQAPAYTGRPRRVRGPWPDALPGIDGPIYAPLRAYLAVEDALADGDSDQAELRVRGLDPAEAFPQGHWQRARFERADPSRGRAVSLSREVEALERALQLDPRLDVARLRLLEIQRERGEDAEVEQILEQLPPARLRGIDGQLLRFSVFLAQGNEYQAEQALARAAALAPRSCKVLMAQRSLARERADVRREDEIAEQLAACAGSLSTRARLAEARGRWDEARALWDEVLERTPDDLSAHENLARVQALRGELPRARAHLEASLRYNPFRVGSHLALADLAATEGDRAGARDQLQQALAKVPHSGALWRSAADLGIADDLMRWRIDGRQALAAYRESGAVYEGVGEVLVLDRSVARVYESGGQRQIVHIMAELRSKESLDRYGELPVPEDAELLTLRTLKPDGRVIEPEIVPGKDGVSLRHLELLDVVEYEYVVERGPAGAVPGYVDVSTFRFQSADVPYHRSELLVVHPESVALRFDARNNPPVDRPSTVDVDGQTLQVHHFRADEVPRLGVEPGMRSWLDELPSVHVYSTLDLPRYLDGLAAQIRDTQRRNPELRRLVRRLTRGQATPREKLRALWSWVVENVEDAGDLSMPATVTLAGRTGSRLMLLRAMLREAGLPAELWLARDAHGPRPLPGGHPLVDSYEIALLAVTLPDADEPVMVMTVSKVMPLGYLASGLRRTDGLRVQLEPHEGPSGPVTLPDVDPGQRDLRRWDLDVSLDARGAGAVEGTITLQGMEAVVWRQALRQIDRDRIEEVFQQAELGWLPGAELLELTLEDED
ncbi:MAG: tetratricopeptide repeat protein, partial [Myxococcales bacterium]|nr:tetratricopeptide repeat protein [Myxococcales bacterium]